ncbi:hypothetical protein J4E08_03390 [Sagittula sp. NFXS13]|uniref:Uncharacterized protein n=1 Tax=Sagittula marina TaxID=943940 RepID=A0A7W6DPD4_9RHOB|nr:hypothetical protein [Sagittula marina]MBB3985241.1 hypothetical protein [Sagittula marina]
MVRNIFYRDFSLCKAAALVGLIGAAMMLGSVPKAEPDIAEEMDASLRMLPVALHIPHSDCAEAQSGIDI